MAAPAGVIVLCNALTQTYSLRRRLFAMPIEFTGLVSRVMAGTPVFLFNVDSRRMFGLFEATADGGLNLDPEAFSSILPGGTSTTSPLPCQIFVSQPERCNPLYEEQFFHVLKDNYTSPREFSLELSPSQLQGLCRIFRQNPFHGKQQQQMMMRASEPLPGHGGPPNKRQRTDGPSGMPPIDPMARNGSFGPMAGQQSQQFSSSEGAYAGFPVPGGSGSLAFGGQPAQGQWPGAGGGATPGGGQWGGQGSSQQRGAFGQFGAGQPTPQQQQEQFFREMQREGVGVGPRDTRTRGGRQVRNKRHADGGASPATDRRRGGAASPVGRANRTSSRYDVGSDRRSTRDRDRDRAVVTVNRDSTRDSKGAYARDDKHGGDRDRGRGDSRARRGSEDKHHGDRDRERSRAGKSRGQSPERGGHRARDRDASRHRSGSRDGAGRRSRETRADQDGTRRGKGDGRAAADAAPGGTPPADAAATVGLDAVPVGAVPADVAGAVTYADVAVPLVPEQQAEGETCARIRRMPMPKSEAPRNYLLRMSGQLAGGGDSMQGQQQQQNAEGGVSQVGGGAAAAGGNACPGLGDAAPATNVHKEGQQSAGGQQQGLEGEDARGPGKKGGAEAVQGGRATEDVAAAGAGGRELGAQASLPAEPDTPALSSQQEEEAAAAGAHMHVNGAHLQGNASSALGSLPAAWAQQQEWLPLHSSSSVPATMAALHATDSEAAAELRATDNNSEQQHVQAGDAALQVPVAQGSGAE